MSEFPTSARAVVIGCGIVGNSLVHHLTRLGWTDVVQIDKGPLPNPGGSTGHASNFIFPVDHSKEMTQLTLESQRQYIEMGVNTECGGIEVARYRGADGGAPAADGVREVVGRRLRPARQPGRDQGARALHRRVDPARWLLLPDRLGRRLPPRRHDHARAGDRLRWPAGVRQHGRQRHGRRARQDPPRAHVAGDDRGRGRRHCLRRVEPASRGDGRSPHPAHSGSPPDDRRRPCAALRGVVERDRVPDRSRHGRVHVRTAGRRRPRDRLLRPPLDPSRPGGDPVDRGGGALADRVPLHPGRLRRSDGARARADARDRRRRVGRREVRDQRAHLAHPRRDADPRRDGRGEGALVGRGGLGQGRPGRRQVARRVDGARRVAHRPPHLRRESLPRSPEDACPREGTYLRGVSEDLRHRASRRAVGQRARHPPLADARPGEGPRCRFLRGRRLGAAAVVRGERAARRDVRRRAARRRVGRPLVVPDRQRGAPRDARARRNLRPVGLRHLRRPGRGRARRPTARGDGADGRAGRTGRLHTRPQPGRRLQVGPDDHAPRRRPLPRRHGRSARDGGQEAVRGRVA